MLVGKFGYIFRIINVCRRYIFELILFCNSDKSTMHLLNLILIINIMLKTNIKTLLLLLILSHNNVQAFNYNDIIARIQVDLNTGLKGIDMLDTWVNTQQSTGAWTDLSYGRLTTANAMNTSDNHLLRLWHIAAAVTKNGHARYNNESYKLAVKQGLEFWHSSNTVDPNWWYNRIYSPQRIGEILIFMRTFEGYIPINTTSGISETKLLDTFQPRTISDITLNGTGANAIDYALHYVYRAALSNDGRLMIDTKNKIQESLSEKIMADKVYHDHGPQIQIASYGWVFVNGTLQLASYLAGTPAAFELNNANFAALVDFVREVQINTVRGSSWDFSVMGRAVSRKNALNAGMHYLSKMAEFIDPENATLYQNALQRINGNKPANFEAPIFNKHYWNSDYTQHARKNYFFSVRNVSRRTVEAETGNGEHLKSHYFSHGATFIAVDGNEYKNIMPLWDWSMIPGTTNVNTTSFPTRSAWGTNFGKTDFVGGLSNGHFGISTLDQNHEGTQAKKSWFFFDDEIVCLGAGIQNTSGLNVRTTLNQTKMETPAYFVEKNANTENMHSISSIIRSNENLHYLRQGNIAYYFPQQGNIKYSMRSHTGRWSDINTSGTTTLESGYVFSLWFDHGINPQNAQYAYIVAPGIDSEQKAKSYDIAKIEIAQNSPSFQAIYHKQLGIYQAVFHQAGTIIFSNLSIEVNEPCIVMITSDGSLHVSDPAKLKDNIRVKILQNGLELTHNLTLPTTSELRGKTVSLSKALPTSNQSVNNNKLFSIHYSNGILTVDTQQTINSRLQLFNQLGQLQWVANIQKHFSCDISNLSPGVYLLQLSDNYSSRSKKFIKH